VHTPGHTPEHLSFLVTDSAEAAEPMGVITGDFVFVGDVGRPDLLEKAAHLADTAVAGARQLYRSLGWFKQLPDHLQVWPGHGAVSACGKGLSAVPQSTVGYERRYNWALGAGDEETFVRQVLAGQPEPPRYFGHMKRINREGPPVLGALPLPERVGERRMVALLAGGATVVDTRPGAEFAGGHLPGSLNIPLGRSWVTYAGSILRYDRDLYLVLADPRPEVAAGLVRGLVSIGLDRIRGYLSPDVLEAWGAEGRPLATTQLVTAQELAARRGTRPVTVLDVRNQSEWAAGHLPGALLVPLSELPDRLGEIPEDGEIVVHCQGGARSAVAVSVLMASGKGGVTNLVGGFGAWLAAGLPVTRD